MRFKCSVLFISFKNKCLFCVEMLSNLKTLLSKKSFINALRKVVIAIRIISLIISLLYLQVHFTATTERPKYLSSEAKSCISLLLNPGPQQRLNLQGIHHRSRCRLHSQNCSEAEQSIFYSVFTSSFLSSLHTQQASTKTHARSERLQPQEELSIFHKSLSVSRITNQRC